MNYLKKKIIPVFFFFALMPFVSPLPINTDTQPVAILLAMMIFFLDFFQRNIRLSKFETYFLLLACFSFLFIGIYGDFEIRHRIGLLAAFFLYYAAFNNLGSLSVKTLSLVTLISSGGIIWHSVDPQSFISFAELITREIKIKDTVIAGRGVSGFAPENSFSSALALTYILCFIYFRENKKISDSFFYFNIGLNVISILLTQSGTGIMFGVLLILFSLFLQSSLKQKIFFLFLSVVVVSIIFNSFLIDTRGGSLLFLVLQDPSYLLVDSSLQERWIGLHVGVASLFNYPLGIGGGGYQFVAERMDILYGLQEIYPYARWTSEETNSALGRYLAEFGIFFLIWFAIIVIRSFSNHPNSGRSALLATLFLIASFSIAFPPTYLLFSLARYTKKLL